MTVRKTLITVGLLLSVAGCTDFDGTLGGTLTPPSPPSSGGNTLLATGTADQVRQELVDSKARSWASDAELIGLQGVRIDGAGVNSANDSRWVYTFRSAEKGATVTFTAMPSGLTGPTAGSNRPGAKAIGRLAYDSDDAVLRYITTSKAKGLDRFDLTLQLNDAGTPTWQITVVDDFGKAQEQGSVNASTGTVTLS